MLSYYARWQVSQAGIGCSIRWNDEAFQGVSGRGAMVCAVWRCREGDTGGFSPPPYAATLTNFLPIF